jgi:UDP-2,3-diacylglucosamine hydrolase
MSDKAFLIVSDVHLGSVPESTERRFRRFLRFAAERATGLLINGDLFDFWFEYRTVIPRKHFRSLAALAEVADAGVPIWFLGGNHDAWMGDFLREEIGVTLLDGPVELTLEGRRALVAHGDGVGQGDWGYRMLKRLIRHPITIGAFRQIHPDWGALIADRVSRTEDRVEGAEAGRNRARFIRAWAEAELIRRPELDLVLAGHCHVPEVTELAPGRFYANSGDWIRNSSYLVLPPGEGAPELRQWEEEGR